MSIWLALIGGIITFVSPCILPLVPVYLATLSGISVQQLKSGEDRPTFRIFMASLAFVIGFTMVFSLMAALFYIFVSSLGDYKEWFNRGAGAILIVFGLHLAGVFRIPFLNYEVRAQAGGKGKSGMLQAFIIGIAFGAGWTPCIGPILSGILFTSAAQSNPASAIGLLLAYSAGLGIPFLLTGLLTSRMITLLDKVKKHMKVVEWIAGGFLVILGVFLMFNMMGWLSGWLTRMLPWLSGIENSLIK